MMATIEQQIQYAIRSAMENELKDEAVVHAQKLDSVDDQLSEEEYPVIVVVTGTPVPQGHKSKIVEIPLWITAMSYLPEDRLKSSFNTATEAIFTVIQDEDDWDSHLPDDPTISISAVVIDSGEEPGMIGKTISQTTACTVHACLTTE